jgi:O-antigen/teichoic acid export membrane protein
MAEERDRSEAGTPATPVGAVVLERSETEFERYDRNLNEILSELRVALPGVQVLFAFLLVAPFNQRFNTVSHFERRVYFAALLCTLLASVLLIAPVLVHRLEFRQRQKAHVVETANRLTIAGLSVFALALALAVLFVTHYLFGAIAAGATTATVIAVVALLWFALPLRHRRANAQPEAPARPDRPAQTSR